MKEEERRFLRALIPGILFIVELCIVLLLILDKSQIKGIFDLLISTNNTSINTNIIAALILVFVGSGGIGHFLGILYRFFYWNVVPLNFCGFLEYFLEKSKLDLRVSTNPKPETIYFSRNGAWRIVNVIFYGRIEKSKCFSGAEGRNDRLFDYMHSSGTIFVGYFAAIFMGLGIGFNSLLSLSFPRIVLLIGSIIILFYVHLFESKTAREHATYFLKGILLNELSNYKIKNKKELRIYIVDNDLSKKSKSRFKKDRRRMLEIDAGKKVCLLPEIY